MKNNLRGKIRNFLASEEGKVAVKAPLALSIANGSFLLAQVMFTLPIGADGLYNSDSNNCLTFCEKHGEELSCTLVCA